MQLAPGLVGIHAGNGHVWTTLRPLTARILARTNAICIARRDRDDHEAQRDGSKARRCVWRRGASKAVNSLLDDCGWCSLETTNSDMWVPGGSSLTWGLRIATDHVVKRITERGLVEETRV